MTIIIEPVYSDYGTSYAVTAIKDFAHRSIVRQFFCYSDAYMFCVSLLANPLPACLDQIFKPLGL